MDGTSQHGRAWRLATAAVILIAIALVSSSAPVDATTWVKKQLKWAGATPDSTYLTDEADTTRTLAIETTDWDWSAMAAVTSTPLTGFVGAHIMFVATASNQAADSIYYYVEHGDGDGRFQTVAHLSAVGALGNCAVVLNPATIPGRIFLGALIADTDAVPALASNVWLSPQFRLQVFGDQGGTTPILSGLRAYIIYPRRSGF